MDALSSRRRIVIYEPIASGGMATVHLARIVDHDGRGRVVVAKRLKAGIADDPELVTMLFDEARFASRVEHPNVVKTIDLTSDASGVMLLLEYVHGETLARLLRSRRGGAPPEIAAAIALGALRGLHAAHQATDADGTPLRLVHRDVSPQNIMIGVDGVPRVLDFGVAKAVGRLRTTRDGSVRGKIGYLAPEQLLGNATPRSDVFSASVVLWEALTGRRLYEVTDPNRFLEVLRRPVPCPSDLADGISRELDRILMRGLAREPQRRYASAGEMADELAASGSIASEATVGAFVRAGAADELARRADLIARVEAGTAVPFVAADTPGAASEEPTKTLPVASGSSADAAAAPPPASARGSIAKPRARTR
jgi:eukaryotic-like serine/threonine-protein kinase